MPGYKAHLAGGLVSFVVLIMVICTPCLSIPTACEWLIFTLLGALFPDIDIKSKGQRIFYLLLAMTYGLLMMQHHWNSVIWLSWLALVPLLVSHRGLFHNFWFIVSVVLMAIGLSCLFIPQLSRSIAIDGIFFVAGVASHLVLDRGILRAFRF